MPQSVSSSSNASTSSNNTSNSTRSRTSSISSSCSVDSISSFKSSFSNKSTNSYSTSSSYSLSSYASSTGSSYTSYTTSSKSSQSLFGLQKRSTATSPISSLFAGMNFYFFKESFQSLNDKQKLVALVKDHNASVSLLLSKKTTHFIVDQPISILLSTFSQGDTLNTPKTITHSLIYQLNSAIKLNVKVATFDFIHNSIRDLSLDSINVASFTREIRLFAPEVSMLLNESTVRVEAELTLDNSTGPLELLSDAEATNTQDREEPVVEIQPMETMAHKPTLLNTNDQLDYTTFVEKNTTCRLFSKIDSMNKGRFDEFSFSFEESRYYRLMNTCDQGVGTVRLDLPVRRESQTGSIWTWGNGSKGQLGSGGKQRHWMPVFVAEDFAEPIAQVASGDFHSAVVTASGSVWTWGTGKSGCLGQGEFKNSDSPLLVERFTDIKVNMIACGKSHTAALTSLGTVWTWGLNIDNQLGYDTGSELKSASPQEVFTITEAVFVACGGNNTATLNRYGHVFTMGCNKFGQRGVGQRKCTTSVPTRVKFPANEQFKYISVGQGFMGAITMEGDLYMWGRNLENQCGNGSAADLFLPEKVSVGTSIIHLSAGETHTACVTSNGDVFTWGWGPAGQLGHSTDNATCTIPTQVEGVSDICMVACGAKHTIALASERGKVWVWGANDCGQAGIPYFDTYYSDDEDNDDEEYEDNENEEEEVTQWLAPQVIESLSKVSTIACGKEHTLALVEKDYVPIQFAKDGDDEAMLFWLENSPVTRDLDNDALKVALNNIRDDELGTDYSLLHWATYFANENVLELLVGKWIDPNVTDKNGDTPLHICAERDIPSCVEILLRSGAKPDLKNKLGKTSIHTSVEHNTSDVLKEIVENSISDKSAVDEGGNTPLHYAVQNKHFGVARYLIERAAQPQLTDKHGKTALDYCTIKEASYLKSIAQQNDVFVSYAHVDLAFASKIKEFLESYAIKCWMDMTRLEAGSDWRLDIGNGLLNSKLVLFVASRASVVSDWCIKELHMAKKHKLVIIPIWFQKVELDSEVRSLIFGRRLLDFSEPKHFETRGKKLSKKLKHVLTIIKHAKLNPYLDIPVLTTEQLWKQLFLTILVESHLHYSAGCVLENVLHDSAIFSCTHNLTLVEDSSFVAVRQANLDRAWGIVFLISNLDQTRAEMEKWWQYAEERGKKVYLCMMRGDATHLKTEDLPSQALKQTSVPIFYLESLASLQQLVFFVYLAQREQFMAKQVGVMEDKLNNAVSTIKENEQELVSLKKRFYVE